MKRCKVILVTAFALFSLFFGAGNLILPPLLGLQSGENWWLMTLGFGLSAVLVPILGILAHARLQGTLFDFGKKVSGSFSLVYCFLIYTISITLPSPRTASVTHEMAIEPLFHSPPWVTSFLYFLLVFLFAMNRSRILDLVGKWLTPAILIILMLIIGLCWYHYHPVLHTPPMARTFTHGMLEGYQTFDAIAATVVGGVILVSLNLKEIPASYDRKKTLIRNAAWIAGMALFLVYAGLILSGALTRSEFDPSISRTALLAGISALVLGPSTKILLSLLVSLACFTTAVGIIAGTADFVRTRFPTNPYSYGITAALACIIGSLVGAFEVGFIIRIAIPVLMFVYPLTIILILLKVLPEKYTLPVTFRWVVATTLLFSVPDFLISIGWDKFPGMVEGYIPLSRYQIGWLVPAMAVFLLSNLPAVRRRKV